MNDDAEVDIVGEYNDDLLSSSASRFDEMGLTLNELLPYLGPNSWLLNSEQVWCVNRASSENKNKESSGKSHKDDKESANHDTTIKSVRNKKPWSESEKELFKKGKELFGNRWTKLSKFIGTRTTLQVKSFARQYLKQSTHVDVNVSSAATAVTTVIANIDHTLNSSNASISEKNVERKNYTPAKSESHQPMEKINHTLLSSKEVIRLNKAEMTDELEDIDIEDVTDCSKSSNDDIKNVIINNDFSPADCHSYNVCVSNPHLSQSECKIFNNSKNSNSDCKSAQFQDTHAELDDGVEEERFFTFKMPDCEKLLERDVILEEEKMVHHEFFEGRPQKTPERYLKIRNYILDSWLKSKPVYLNKTSVRPGLRNCGDVNCIGRIHSYLELTGAINFGCEQTVYDRPLSLMGRSLPVTKKLSQNVTISKQLAMRPRKRKIPVLKFDLEAGGYTIEHDKNGEIMDFTEGIPATSITKRSKNKKRNDNPFQLVNCASFTETDPAPFSVKVDIKALLMMDIHAHLSTLEVIGLLGGRYDHQNCVLTISIAEPCESLSTGLECEMDPVSQTQASEKLQQLGYSIIGWYHSHPTFAPNPSLRDLETQSKFQEWFGHGGSPFLGIIVSPFYSSVAGSKFRYMIVGQDRLLLDGQHPSPYKFIPTIKCVDSDLQRLISDIDKLFYKWMPILCSSNGSKATLSAINKLIGSVYHYLTMAVEDQSTVATFLSELGRIIASHLPSEAKSLDPLSSSS